ncbi:MAG TPA: START domain-containing protein [Polyangiaceae bacterium]|nr:START domain-containing protein [Polyangiaceae bacterium]
MRIRKLALALTLALAPVFVASSGSADAPRWERVTESGGVTVFKQEVEGSPVIAFKGIGVVNAPIARVAAVVTDSNRTPEWMDSVADAHIVRQVSPFERIVYTHLKSPPLIADRDFVTAAKAEFDRANKRVIIRIHSVADASAPPTSHVRGQILHSSFVLTSVEGGQKTLVVTEIHADPKGSLPTWVVNLFQKDWPVKTIRNLRAQCAKGDIKEAPALAAQVAGF